MVKFNFSDNAQYSPTTTGDGIPCVVQITSIDNDVFSGIVVDAKSEYIGNEISGLVCFLLHKVEAKWNSVKCCLPEAGQVVSAKIQHWRTKGIKECKLVYVNEDDCSWRTEDDLSELDYNWNVVVWMLTNP